MMTSERYTDAEAAKNLVCITGDISEHEEGKLCTV